jgi:hypothetical protein
MTGHVGTPYYRALEPMRSEAYAHRVDVYSDAMVCFEMAADIRPFAILKMNELFRRVVQWNMLPQMSVDLPRPLEKLIKKCWNADPNQRPSFRDISQTFADGKAAFADTYRKTSRSTTNSSSRTRQRRGRPHRKPQELNRKHSRTSRGTGPSRRTVTASRPRATASSGSSNGVVTNFLYETNPSISTTPRSWPAFE